MSHSSGELPKVWKKNNVEVSKPGLDAKGVEKRGDSPMNEQFGYRVSQVSYKDYREFCEKCPHLLSKVFVGNHFVTVYCSKMKCEHMPKEEEEELEL